MFELGIDLIDVGTYIEEKGGIRYGLVAIDNFIKYAWVQPMKEKNAKSLIDALTEIIYKMGHPKQIYTDMEGAMTNKEFISWITNTKKFNM